MKTFILLMLIFFSFCQAGAQGTDVPKVKYLSSVYQLGSEIPIKGAIVTTGDSTIQFIDRSLFKRKNLIAPELIQVIPSISIDRIKTRRKNSVGRGAIRGLLAGVAFGAIYGYTTTGKNDFFSPGENATIAAVLFSIPGLIAGTIVGANVHNTTKINGDPASYAVNREKLKKYTITGN